MAASKEEAPSAEGEAVADDTASPDIPDIKERRTVEASPTWMAPTDGFIGCVEALFVTAHVSLEDGTPMTAEDLNMKLKVRNPETGEEETLEEHALVAEIQVSLPEDLFQGINDAFRRGTVRRVGEESGSEEPSGPTSLKVSLKIASTRPPDPALMNLPMGDACAEERAYKRSKTFVLEGRYRRRFIPYSGQEDFQLAPEEIFTGLDKLVLSKPRLFLPVGSVLKGRLTR